MLTVLTVGVGVLPLAVKPYQLEILIFLFLNIIVVVSYRFILITGEWSFCHIVIMGIGGYASALLVKSLGVSAWLGVPAGAAAAAALAYVLSFPLFRMKGFYFIIGSFVAGEAIRLCWLKYRFLFGGTNGISAIPPLKLGTIDLSLPIPFYFFVFVVMSICLFALYRLERSRFGMILAAVASSDLLAGTVGINCRRYRMLAFVVSAFFAGLAGALLAHYMTAVSPHVFGLPQMLAVMVWAIVGGIGGFAGPIVGAVVLSLLDESLRGFEQYRPGVYGLLLILSVMFFPKGLRGLPEQLGPIAGRVVRSMKKQLISRVRERPAA